MPALRVATEPGSFTTSPAGDVISMAELSTPPGIVFDSRYVRGAVIISGTRTYTLANNPVTTSLWLHWDSAWETPASPITTNSFHELVALLAPAGNVIIDIATKPNSAGYFVRYRDASAYNNLSPELTALNKQYKSFDLFVSLATGLSPSTVQLFVNGASVFSFTGLIGIVNSSIQTVRFAGQSTNHFVSQCILADESTVGWKLRVVNGVFTNFPTFNEWVAVPFGNWGTTNVAETLYDERTYAVAAGPGVKSLAGKPFGGEMFPAEPVGGPSNVDSVHFYGVFKNAPASSVNDVAFLYFSGLNIGQSAPLGLLKNDVITRKFLRVPSNPLTSGPWQLSQFQTFEWGVVST